MEDTTPFSRRQDDVNYGMLWQKVKDMEKKLDRLEESIDELLALANRSKGGFWVGMTIASFLGGFITWVLTHIRN